MLPASGPEDTGDPYREARAYNNSVLFMLGMPYLLTGTVAFLIWREVRKAQRKQAACAASLEVTATAHP